MIIYSISGAHHSASELTKKSVIPTGILYHKKAKPRAEDEIGRRKEQIFVNTIAKQYTYVVEEETITSPVEDTDKNSIAKEVNEVETDDHGATYRIHEGYLGTQSYMSKHTV